MAGGYLVMSIVDHIERPARSIRPKAINVYGRREEGVLAPSFSKLAEDESAGDQLYLDRASDLVVGRVSEGADEVLLGAGDGLDIVGMVVDLGTGEHGAARDRHLFLGVPLAGWVQLLDAFEVAGVHDRRHIEVREAVPPLEGNPCDNKLVY